MHFCLPEDTIETTKPTKLLKLNYAILQAQGIIHNFHDSPLEEMSAVPDRASAEDKDARSTIYESVSLPLERLDALLFTADARLTVYAARFRYWSNIAEAVSFHEQYTEQRPEICEVRAT